MIQQICLRSLLLPKLLRPRLTRQVSGSNSAAYDGDGKTTVRVLNDEEPHLFLVNTYSHCGFRLSNNLFVKGSILLFPTYVYSWNVQRGIDITAESLIVFDLIVPKPKIIVIGYGEKGEPHDLRIPLLLKKKGISCEYLPTPSAVTTYNYLVHDSVHVAGAFIPIKKEVLETGRDTEFYKQDMYFKPVWPRSFDEKHEDEKTENIEKYKKFEKEKVKRDSDKKGFDDI